MKNHTLHGIFAATVTAALFMAPAMTATAEDLRVSVKSQVERGLQESLPRHGTNESSVRSDWGQPQSVTGPVGEPPIHQWHYQNFVVYFEGNRVIHSVLKQGR